MIQEDVSEKIRLFYVALTRAKEKMILLLPKNENNVELKEDGIVYESIRKKYNSFENGYNATEGGEEIGNRVQKGSKNGRARLTEEDVIYIRECYNNHIPFRKVYLEYKDKITERGLQKVWWFETWKNIHPEYHTKENKYWHSHNAKGDIK